MEWQEGTRGPVFAPRSDGGSSGQDRGSLQKDHGLPGKPTQKKYPAGSFGLVLGGASL